MTDHEGHTAQPLSRGRLAAILGGAFAAAALLMVAVILPAEFGVDPTGIGKLTGLAKLGAPAPKTETVTESAMGGMTARYYLQPFRADEVEIKLEPAGASEQRDRIEYKVHLNRGDTLIYAWTAPDLPKENQLHYDFHGEKPASGGAAARVAEYQKGLAGSSNGMLVAPMEGVHGWYFENRAKTPVTIRVKLSGFYELVPPGDYGNLGGISAKSAPN